MFNSTERSVITSCSLGLPSPPCSTPWKQPGAEGANDEASSLPIPRQSTELLREATQQPHEKYATRQLSTKQAVTPHVRFLVLIAATFGLFNAPRLSRTRWCANTCLAYTRCHHQHHPRSTPLADRSPTAAALCPTRARCTREEGRGYRQLPAQPPSRPHAAKPRTRRVVAQQQPPQPHRAPPAPSPEPRPAATATAKQSLRACAATRRGGRHLPAPSPAGQANGGGGGGGALPGVPHSEGCAVSATGGQQSAGFFLPLFSIMQAFNLHFSRTSRCNSKMSPQ